MTTPNPYRGFRSPAEVIEHAVWLYVELSRFRGHPEPCKEVFAMGRTHKPYPEGFRRQMVDLVRAGRGPYELACEFEPSIEAIRAWVKQADREEGRGFRPRR